MKTKPLEFACGEGAAETVFTLSVRKRCIRIVMDSSEPGAEMYFDAAEARELAAWLLMAAEECDGTLQPPRT